MEKREYVEPEMEVIMFESCDIITASNGTGMGDGIVLPDDEW